MDEFEELLGDRLRGPGPAVPPEVDAAVMQLFRQGAARRRRRRRWRLVGAAGVAAAAAAAGLLLWPRPVAAGPTVLDAYRLAARLERGDATGNADDHDGDGRVDREDVRALLRRAVSLGGAGR